jgi:phytoene dehydrogenase-like protein
MQRTGHAVVLGAGIAGLLAARVLTDTYDHVTVIERDRFAAHRFSTSSCPASSTS